MSKKTEEVQVSPIPDKMIDMENADALGKLVTWIEVETLHRLETTKYYRKVQKEIPQAKHTLEFMGIDKESWLNFVWIISLDQVNYELGVRTSAKGALRLMSPQLYNDVLDDIRSHVESMKGVGDE